MLLKAKSMLGSDAQFLVFDAAAVLEALEVVLCTGIVFAVVVATVLLVVELVADEAPARRLLGRVKETVGGAER